jgi:hypothetical protein
MGFMDKAKKFAEQAQQEAKDGTLKQRAKALADQAQAKLDEVQKEFNEGQKPSAPEAGDAVAGAPSPAVSADLPQGAASTGNPRGEGEQPPTMTSGDPLAG